MLPNETFGSLFGASLDLKNDLTNPHGVYTTSTTLQPQNLPMMSAALPMASAQQFLPAGSTVNQCMSSVNSVNSPTTPTIYTIEDHGGGTNALINLAPATNASVKGASHQKKRKLSSAETASSSSAPSSNNKSLNVKQEPRKLIVIIIFSME